MNTTKLENGVTEHFHHASERLEELKDQVTNVVGSRINSFTGLVKKHPIASIGIGLGIAIGFVVTFLSRRRE
jgi:ElaB/YqjD/DUF883 family membrane-anchored ribosome-binding protein